MQAKPFSMRAFVSLLLGFIFIGLSLSGIALYIAPQCRVAGFIGWAFLGLPKESWAAIHLVTALGFIFLAIAHLLVYNLRAMLSYFRSHNNARARKGLRLEVVLSLVVFAVLVGGSAWLVPPFSWLPDGHSAIEMRYREKSGFDERPRGQGSNRGPAQGLGQGNNRPSQPGH